MSVPMPGNDPRLRRTLQLVIALNLGFLAV